MPKVVSSVEEYWGEIHSAGEDCIKYLTSDDLNLTVT